MGCHTWAYKKIATPPFEAMKKKVLRVYSQSIKNTQKWIDNPQDPECLDTFGYYSDWTIEDLKRWQAIGKRKIRLIESGFCKNAVINKYCEHSPSLTMNHNGTLYTKVEFGNMFRKYGYPNDKLFSLEQTLDYINNPNNKCVVYDNTIEELKKFWNKYPDGMIKFG